MKLLKTLEEIYNIAERIARGEQEYQVMDGKRVRSDVEEACPSIITELFNWIGEYAEIPKEFLTRLEKIL